MTGPNQLHAPVVWVGLFAILVAWMAPWFYVDSYGQRATKFLLTVNSDGDPIAFQVVSLVTKGWELMGALTLWYALFLSDFFNETGACCSNNAVGLRYAAFAILNVVFLALYKSWDALYAMGTRPPAQETSMFQRVARKVYLVGSALAVFFYTFCAIWIMAIYWANFSGNGVMTAAAILWTIYAVLWNAFIWYLTYVYIYRYYNADTNATAFKTQKEEGSKMGPPEEV
jgi:hypothetical protein